MFFFLQRGVSCSCILLFPVDRFVKDPPPRCLDQTCQVVVPNDSTVPRQIRTLVIGWFRLVRRFPLSSYLDLSALLDRPSALAFCGCRPISAPNVTARLFATLLLLASSFFFLFFFVFLLGFELGVVEYGATIEAFEKAGKPERGLDMFDEMVSTAQRVHHLFLSLCHGCLFLSLVAPITLSWKREAKAAE